MHHTPCRRQKPAGPTFHTTTHPRPQSRDGAKAKAEGGGRGGANSARRSKVRGLSAPEVGHADFPRHDPPPPPTPTRHPRPRQMPLGLNPPRARAKSRRVRFPTPPTGPPQTRTRPGRHQKSTGPTSCSTNTGHAATAAQTGSTAFGGRGTLAGHTGTRPGRLPTPAPGRGGDVPMATRQKSARSTFHTANRPRPRPGEGANAKAEAEGKGKAEGEDRSGARCADRQHQKSAGPTFHATPHPGRSPGTGASTGAGQATARRSGMHGLPTPEVGGADFLLRRNGPSSAHGKHRSSGPRRSGRQSGTPHPLPTPEVGGPTSHATTHPGRAPGTGASTGAGQATARGSGVRGLPTPEVGQADFLRLLPLRRCAGEAGAPVREQGPEGVRGEYLEFGAQGAEGHGGPVERVGGHP